MCIWGGIELFQSLGFLCLCMMGRCFLSWLHEEFTNCFGSVGSQYLPWASFSKKLLYVWAQVLCTRTHACVGTQGSCLPVMPMFHFDYRKEHTHVLLLCGFGDAALACRALKDSKLPLLKRMVFKEPVFSILLLLWTNPVSRMIKGLK